jgi:hypothetical protein
MAALMVPAVAEGHASLSGIGVTFAFFAWAAVSGARGRRRAPAPGAVGDPFAMGLLMSAPYVALVFAGHGHGAHTATTGSDGALVLGVAVVGGWVLLRRRSARAPRAERFGFAWCLLMLVAMLLAMNVHG